MIHRVESDKTASIHYFYLYPGSQGSGCIQPGAKPANVFLDEAYRGPGKGEALEALTYSSDPVLKQHYGREYYDALATAEREVGNRDTALFFERALSTLFQEEVDLKLIATGVSSMNGEHYHDLGYLTLGR